MPGVEPSTWGGASARKWVIQIERRGIFRDDADGADLVARVATSVTGTGLTVCTWAPLTGYAGAINRRHHRVATSSKIGTSPSWRRKSRTTSN
jgi:hypothetical protein